MHMAAGPTGLGYSIPQGGARVAASGEAALTADPRVKRLCGPARVAGLGIGSPAGVALQLQQSGLVLLQGGGHRREDLQG